jgi:hypothetical protein
MTGLKILNDSSFWYQRSWTEKFLEQKVNISVVATGSGPLPVQTTRWALRHGSTATDAHRIPS